MNKKNWSMITTVQQEGFLSYFFSQFTSELTVEVLIDLTKDEDFHRWIFVDDQTMFQTSKDVMVKVEEGDINTFLKVFIDKYCQSISFQNVSKYIDITKDESERSNVSSLLKHEWIMTTLC